VSPSRNSLTHFSQLMWVKDPLLSLWNKISGSTAMRLYKAISKLKWRSVMLRCWKKRKWSRRLRKPNFSC
jgi:hypothetical protein